MALFVYLKKMKSEIQSTKKCTILLYHFFIILSEVLVVGGSSTNVHNSGPFEPTVVILLLIQI